MRFHKKRCLLLLLFTLCSISMTVYYFTIKNTYQAEVEMPQKKLLLDDVFAAVLNVVEFLSTDYRGLNMDGLYGYRICQGSLVGTVQDCSHKRFSCPEGLVDRIQAMTVRIDELGQLALPFVKQKDVITYNTFLPALKVPFMVKYIPEKWHRLPQHMPPASGSYNGILGDRCFGGIMGTYIDGDRKSLPCTIVDGCWAMMTLKGTIGYYTTHQLLYLLFGEQSGCKQTLEDLVRREMRMSLRDWQRHLCEQIYLDATVREYNLQVDVMAEDLFLEQIALCGVLGFQNFFNETWIPMVLSWQTPRGCFAMPGSTMDVHVEVQKAKDEMYQLENEISEKGESIAKRDKGEAQNRIYRLKIDNMRRSLELSRRYESINSARGARTGRSLMTERVMGSDCLSHKTGVGAAALAGYFRYLVSELYAKK